MPATYQKKYWYTFGTLDGKINKVELWQNTATVLTAEEVKGMPMPFSVEMPDLDHKFQVVRGTGCEINLISMTDGKFFDGLYHTDIKEFMVKHYIKTAGAGDETYVINWLGYLNSELVREPYSETTKYPFQITGNDGFSLLDRLHFIDNTVPAALVNYTGTKSIYDIICIVLDRIGLPFTQLRIALSTTSASITIAAENTLLNYVYIDCANFYNEDNEAETMRTVLDAVLRPFGAFITQVGGNIYITDVNLFALGGSAQAECFETTGWTWAESVNLAAPVDLPDIGYMGTGSEKEMSGGKNKQVIKYSPYPLKAVLPEGLASLDEFTGAVPGSFSLRDDSHYSYRALTGNKQFAAYSPGSFEQSYRVLGVQVPPEEAKDASICLTYHAGTAGTKVLDTIINPVINISIGKTVNQTADPLFPTRGGRSGLRGVAIKLTGEAEFYRYWGDKDGETRSAKIKILFRVGDKTGYFTNQDIPTVSTTKRTNPTPQISPGSAPSGYWQDYPGDPQLYEYITIKNNDNSNIAGTWMPFEGRFINSIDLSGEVHLEIYSDLSYFEENGEEYSDTDIHHAQIRIRNLALTIVDPQTGKEQGDADIEYIGYLNRELKEEAEPIDLICGTDVLFTDRGKMMTSAGASIPAFTRNTQSYKIEELLLASLSANYKMGYLTLSNLKLKNGFNQLNLLTDTDFLGAKNLMVKSAKTNFRDNLIETTLVEITEDNLTIVPYV